MSPPDATPYGKFLAHKVTDLLAQGGRVGNGFSAHWLILRNTHYSHEILKSCPRKVNYSTSNPKEFEAWLSHQSAQTLDDAVRPHCNDIIEIFDRTILEDAVRRKLGVLDKTPYGISLATRITDALDSGMSILNTHRDYCGMGLVKEGENYVYGSVFDGYLQEPDPSGSFGSRKEFIDWLASQSDALFAGREIENEFYWDNQRITRQRLEDALKTSASSN